MAGWQQLTDHLRKASEAPGRLSLSTAQIEAIIEGRLPPSSSKRWFWANTYHRYYARFWLDAGWKVNGVTGRVIEFVRQPVEGDADRRYAPTKYEESASQGIVVSLTDGELQSMKEWRTDQKAMEIVKKYLKSEYGSDVQIEYGGDGVDLRVSLPDGRRLEIEVKGAAKADIAWSQLKVSGQASYDKLERGVLIYRVTDVNSRTPRICVLVHGRHFSLEPEARWAVRPARP